MKTSVKIIFEDDKLIVVDKPAGYLSIPGRNNDAPSVLTALRANRDDLYPVHRLDMNTSGVLILAKSLAVHKEMNQLFESRQVEKSYLAITKGNPANDHGEVNENLIVLDQKTIISKKGKVALSSYQTLEEFRQYAYLNVNISTGRRHQIRVHLAYLNCPIVCDPLYGDGQPFFLSSIKKKFNSRNEERPLLSRTALHAHKISFQLSEEDELRSYSSEAPKDMRAMLNQLRKNG